MNRVSLYTLLLILNILLATPIFAQNSQISGVNKPAIAIKKVQADTKSKKTRFIQLNDETGITEKNQVNWLKKTLLVSKNHTFKELARETDKLNITHTKYQLHYKNIPVEGAIYNIHSQMGKTTMANGEYYLGNDISCTPSINEKQAYKNAISYVQARKYRWEIEQTERPRGNLIILPIENKYVLAYKYDIYAVEPLSRQYIYIDANSGEVLKTLNLIHEIDVVGKAETLYNGMVSITTEFSSGSYRLREKGRGNGIETQNLRNGSSVKEAIDFTDDDNYWNDATNNNSAAYDLHFGTEVTYDYYRKKFGRNSFDNKGSTIVSYAHYGDNYANAFWDGQSLFYGDGTPGTDLPFTTLDIVAHEITHAVTQHSAGLEYVGESGALNESFSDIFGTNVDFFIYPGTANYEIGEGISLTDTPFRDMANPNRNYKPDTYQGLYWDPLQEVHCNSGVQNYWYYLLCEGGAGTNDLGEVYQVNAIGREKATQIAYRNLTVYLTPTSDYEDARFYSIQSAKDLFGDCSAEASTVANAWYAVGIGDANDCDSPENFNATQISNTQVNLKWAKNQRSNNVLIACSTSRNMGDPQANTEYTPGDQIPGGGLVIYSGSDTTFHCNGIEKGVKFFFKAWTVKPDNSYSGGVRTKVKEPTIDAGKDLAITLPREQRVNLLGMCSDDFPLDSIQFEWKKIRGKEGVEFENANSNHTAVKIDSAGIYTFQLTMNCFGFSAQDTLNVYVGLTESISELVINEYNNWIGMEIRDSLAYLAELTYGMKIFDISDVKNPVQISGFEKFNVKFIHVEGDYAYISQNFEGGLTILDVKDKLNPKFVSYLDIPNASENEDFILKDNLVYFTSIPDGIIIIDVSDPKNPVKIGNFACAPVNIALRDNYLYVTERNFNFGMEVFILDISDPTNPQRVKNEATIYSYFCAPTVIQGEYLYKIYSASQNNRFRFFIYDISDRKNPKIVGSTGVSWNNSSLYIQGNYAYTGDGLTILDVSDKTNPKISSIKSPYSFDQVIAKNDLIFCTQQKSFSVEKAYLANLPPYVYAGQDLKIDSVQNHLQGEIYDEGLPKNGVIELTWSKVSGPGNVLFSNVHSLNSKIAFSEPGSYTIRLKASDGELSSYDEMVCEVTDEAAVKSVPDSAKLIAGAFNVCKNATYTYSTPTIAGADYYEWLLPPGANGISSTNNITVSFDSTATSGFIHVKGVNVRGDGVEISQLVNVRGITKAPEICLSDGILQSNLEMNQWYFNDSLIPGAVFSTYIPTKSGTYYSIATIDHCSSQKSNVISFIVTGIAENKDFREVTIYPNPTNDKITIVCPPAASYVVEIYNELGALIQTILNRNTNTSLELDLSAFSKGTYVVRIRYENKVHAFKVMRS